MGVGRFWRRAQMRRGGRQQVALALIVAIAGGMVLACLAAARRTDSVHARYVRDQAIPQLEAFVPDTRAVRTFRTLPSVRTVGTWRALYAAPDRSDVIPGQDFIVVSPADDVYAHDVDRPIVTAGRMPRGASADEVLVNERAARALHLHIGTRVRLRSFGMSEAAALQGGDFDKITFSGPRPVVRVVGIGRSRVDLYRSSYAQQYFLTGRAFGDRYAKTMFGWGTLADVVVTAPDRVAPTATAIARRLPPGDGPPDVNRIADSARGLRDAARVEAIALLLLAVASLAAGVVMVSQAINRSVAPSARDYEVLSALGVTRRERAMCTAVAFLPIAAGGAVIAVGGACIASRWFPTGVPREAEVQRGTQFDAWVLALGAVLIVVAVVVRAGAAAWRLDTRRRPQLARPSRTLDRVGATLTPPVATGLRWALGRRDGSRAHPRGAITGAVIGLAGVLAVSVYAASVDHVVSSRAAYGWSYDADAGGGNDARAVNAIRDAALQQDVIADVGIVTIVSRVVVGGRPMQGWAFDRVRGTIGPSVVAGRAPAHDDEVLVGTKSAEALHVGIGDVVHARRADGHDVSLRVVGRGLFSTTDSDQFTTGIVTTGATLATLNGTEPVRDVAINWKAGVEPETAARRLRNAGIVVTLASPAPDVLNLRLVRDYPRWLAAFFVLLGLVATVHALFVSTRRRSHEVAVLRALGFSRRQVSRSVSVQGVVVGFVVAVAGTTIGFAIGRLVWHVHAHHIGVSTTVQASVVTTLLVAVGAVVVIWCISSVAARTARRMAVARALHVE